MPDYLKKLVSNYPALIHLQEDIKRASDLSIQCYRNRGTIYTCGNGGSAVYPVKPVIASACPVKYWAQSVVDEFYRGLSGADTENIVGE